MKKELKLLCSTDKYIIKTREYLFKKYDVNDRKVDECVHSAGLEIEDTNFSPINCSQDFAYSALYNDVFKNVREVHLAK